MAVRVKQILQDLLILLTVMVVTLKAELYNDRLTLIKYTFRDANDYIQTRALLGRYDNHAVPKAIMGKVIRVTSFGAEDTGCNEFVIKRGPRDSWVCLVKRGGCTFHSKVEKCFKAGASAAIIYNNREGDTLQMVHTVDLMSVFIKKSDGDLLARLVKDQPIKLNMTPVTEVGYSALAALGLDVATMPPPKVVVVHAWVGEHVYLSCQRDTLDKVMTVEWLVGLVTHYAHPWKRVLSWEPGLTSTSSTFMNQTVDIDTRDGSLYIEVTHIVLEGIYTCFIMDDTGPEFNHVHLYVHAPPTQTRIRGLEDPVIRGQRVNVTCETHHVRPSNVSFYWTIQPSLQTNSLTADHPDLHLLAMNTEGKRRERENGNGTFDVELITSLQLNNSYERHDFICIVTHGVFSDAIDIVRYPIEITEVTLGTIISPPPTTIIGVIGRSVLLPCTLETTRKEGNEISRQEILRWSRICNGSQTMIFQSTAIELPKSGKYKIHGHYNLQVNELGLEDDGTYVCELLFSRGTFSTKLTIVGPPAILHGPKDQVVKQGNPVMFQCQTDMEREKFDIFRWRFLSNETKTPYGDILFQSFPHYLIEDNRYRVEGRFNLIINNTGPADEGDYVCELLLSGESQQAVLRVNGHGKTGGKKQLCKTDTTTASSDPKEKAPICEDNSKPSKQLTTSTPTSTSTKVPKYQKPKITVGIASGKYPFPQEEYHDAPKMYTDRDENLTTTPEPTKSRKGEFSRMPRGTGEPVGDHKKTAGTRTSYTSTDSNHFPSTIPPLLSPENIFPTHRGKEENGEEKVSDHTNPTIPERTTTVNAALLYTEEIHLPKKEHKTGEEPETRNNPATHIDKQTNISTTWQTSLQTKLTTKTLATHSPDTQSKLKPTVTPPSDDSAVETTATTQTMSEDYKQRGTNIKSVAKPAETITPSRKPTEGLKTKPTINPPSDDSALEATTTTQTKSEDGKQMRTNPKSAAKQADTITPSQKPTDRLETKPTKTLESQSKSGTKLGPTLSMIIQPTQPSRIFQSQDTNIEYVEATEPGNTYGSWVEGAAKGKSALIGSGDDLELGEEYFRQSPEDLVSSSTPASVDTEASEKNSD